MSPRARLSLDAYERGVVAGDRTILARAVTLVESARADDQSLAQALLARLWTRTGGAHRVGITGVPGVGKSTLLDALGTLLLERGLRVAVLAVDPSSRLTGGSILGDKTRMPRLAVHPASFVRPSPSGGSLGGVTRRTREAMAVCEAAGFDVVLVETVGVGQSETAVADMVDTFVALALPGAGDELQGIKKGVLELADVIAVNKADGDGLPAARRAKADYDAALRYLRPRFAAWRARCVLVSGATGEGLEPLWALVEEHRAALVASGDLERLRREQRGRWLWSMIEERLVDAFRSDPRIAARLASLEREVIDGALPASQAADALLRDYR